MRCHLVSFTTNLHKQSSEGVSCSELDLFASFLYATGRDDHDSP